MPITPKTIGRRLRRAGGEHRDAHRDHKGRSEHPDPSSKLHCQRVSNWVNAAVALLIPAPLYAA